LRTVNEFSDNEEVAFSGHQWDLKSVGEWGRRGCEAMLCRAGKVDLGKHRQGERVGKIQQIHYAVRGADIWMMYEGIIFGLREI
jgi:hypothetical protein